MIMINNNSTADDNCIVINVSHCVKEMPQL